MKKTTLSSVKQIAEYGLLEYMYSQIEYETEYVLPEKYGSGQEIILFTPKAIIEAIDLMQFGNCPQSMMFTWAISYYLRWCDWTDISYALNIREASAQMRTNCPICRSVIHEKQTYYQNYVEYHEEAFFCITCMAGKLLDHHKQKEIKPAGKYVEDVWVLNERKPAISRGYKPQALREIEQEEISFILRDICSLRSVSSRKIWHNLVWQYPLPLLAKALRFNTNELQAKLKEIDVPFPRMEYWKRGCIDPVPVLSDYTPKGISEINIDDLKPHIGRLQNLVDGTDLFLDFEEKMNKPEKQDA